MALRKIVTEGDEILNKKSRETTNFDERLAILIDDMIETMRDSDGLGLAAVQVGVLRRVVVVETDSEEPVMELINPKIIYKSDEIQCGAEGCLSFPEQQAIVERPNIVKVRAQDRTGKVVEYEGEGLLARAFCHELDHLDGVVFLDVALSDQEAEDWVKAQEEAELELAAMGAELVEELDEAVESLD